MLKNLRIIITLFPSISNGKILNFEVEVKVKVEVKAEVKAEVEEKVI